MNESDDKQAALTVAISGSFVTPFMASAINVALPAIAHEFSMDAVLLSWIATSFLLAAAAFLVPLGKLADIHGRKKVYTCGMIVFTLASLLSAAAWSAYMLILCRVVQGAGAAMIFSTGMAILTSVFPPQERGRALGISVAAVYIGLSIGPFIGGLLTEHFGWRSVFLFNVPIGVLTICLVFLKLKGEWAEAAGEKFDLLGSLIYGASLVALMYGVSLAPSRAAMWLMFGGLAGAAVFVTWENNVRNPVFDLSLFRVNRVFAFSSLAALLHYAATFSIMFLMSLYLQHVKGLSPRDAGLVLVTQPVLMALFSPSAGRLSDRIEPRIVASAGMGITAVGLLALAFMQEDWPLVAIVGILGLVGFGFAFFSSPNMNAIMGSVEPKFYGLASGSVGTMRLLGQMLSMGTATLIFALVIGRVQISAEHHHLLAKSLHYTFFIFSGLCGLGIILSMARGELRNGQHETRSTVPSSENDRG
jgi:EmrB/QacA subfamily drug resistance transporter